MKILTFRDCAIALSAIALLAGCGGSQPPIGAPGAKPQSRTSAQVAARGKSWMLREATSEDLIYASVECGGTCVLSYPDGKQVGALSTRADALCSDVQGNVFLSGGSTITEYAHGGTTPIATLSLPGDSAAGCSVDPVTGNLAVVFSGNGANVAVFSPGSGTPALVETHVVSFYCGYDNAGNLFVSGHGGTGHPSIAEIPYGHRTATILTVNGKLGNPGQMQWDGSYMTYENITAGSPFSIAQLSISGSVATVVGTTPFQGHMRYAWQSWIYKGSVLLPYGKKADNINKLGLWSYPKGGKAKKIVKFQKAFTYDFLGVTVSVAPRR